MPQSESTPRVELVCPAGTLPALRAAVDHGADAVYIGFRGQTNARNFPGLNFSIDEAAAGIEHARLGGARVFIALNVYPMPKSWPAAAAAVDAAAALGADALILADPGLMEYARQQHPYLRLHLSVQGSATNWRAIEFYRREFDIQRAVLPRVLSATQVERLIERTAVEIEVFGFGSLCVMVEGRCALSSYATGHSPNMQGVCSPAHAVRWEETAATQNLLPHVRKLRNAGVDVLRLSPQSRDFLAVVHAFHAALSGDGDAMLPAPFLPGGYCDGYLDGAAGLSFGANEQRMQRPAPGRQAAAAAST